jgi:hypothetical protein
MLVGIQPRIAAEAACWRGVMMIRGAMHQFITENALIRRAYYRLRSRISGGQSDESQIIERLAKSAPRTFVEFGFHPNEFNCAPLARSPDWRGLLIDTNARQIADARSMLSNRIEIVEAFLTLENLDFIKSKFPQIGVLSIDVDGNDYWFLERLIDTRPTVICVEYNASFGPESITVPYDPDFSRNAKHPSGWYHGASLTALTKLAAKSGYGLAAVSEVGGNAIFTVDGSLDPGTSWRPNRLRDKWSGKSANEQWLAVKHLEYVSV